MDDGHLPLPYQVKLATGETTPALLDVPTGLGKTAAAILAWTWRRRFDPRTEIRANTPRRLVYCLPMRVLVEQTYRLTMEWLSNLGLAADSDKAPMAWTKPSGDQGGSPINVHLLIGGGDKSDWALWPERDAILIGTQDMLLSRSLNRGYSAGRGRWPLEFGFLNSDCLWVFDEIQIMDTGLATSLQFDAWRHLWPLRRSRSDFRLPSENPTAKPCHSIWMSATMARHWLHSAVDWAPQADATWGGRGNISKADRENRHVQALFAVNKQCTLSGIALEKPKTKDGKAEKADADRKQSDYLKQLATALCKSENRDPAGLSLIILNTVDRAVQLFQLLKDRPELSGIPLKLIHSRFRPLEREKWGGFLAQKSHAPRILISTQVVEAGVDMSAGVLYTELAPWASLVQRFGRCARNPGQTGRVFWLNLGVGDEKQPVSHWARPYQPGDLRAARKQLEKLDDVGLESLTRLRIRPEREESVAETLFPYQPRFVPRKKDLIDLFDTTPDLTGADVDVSRFIRDGEELDIQVFWREVAEKPGKNCQPDRLELCPVPFHRFRLELKDLLSTGRIWRKNYRKGWDELTLRDRDEIYPGQMYLMEKTCGGYSPIRGWTGNPKDTDFVIPDTTPAVKETRQDEEEDDDGLSQVAKWLTVFEHTRDVCEKLDGIMRDSALSKSDESILRLAARWHDRGKAHECFQGKMQFDAKGMRRLGTEPAAKAPESAWLKSSPRRGFRHELASALAIFETLYCAHPEHAAFAWPDGLTKTDFKNSSETVEPTPAANESLADELNELSVDELDLLVYLVAAHHGKVRMSIRSSPDDDSCPDGKRQARGVRDDEELRACQIPSAEFDTAMTAPTVKLTLEPMELGLSQRYGASWRERTEFLLERLGPFRLAYLEGLLRAADCRASNDEDQGITQVSGQE